MRSWFIHILFCVTLICVYTISSAQNSSDQDIANEYYSKKEYSKAVIYFQKLYNKTPNQLFYSRLLNCLIELEEFKNAEKLVKKQMKNNAFDASLMPI